MVRRRKDSSLAIYVSLIASIAIISNITLVLRRQLVLYTPQQYRQDSRELKNLYRVVELSSRSQTSAFSEPPEPQECLMEKPLNFLHPLANYEGCSRNYARAWEICCPNVVLNVFCLFAQKGRTLETSCLLTIYYFSLPTKMDIVEDSVLNGED